eukprot:NODE_617_length_1485_cov_314.962396_g464_i0.p1 GENE.NODE_617_length_1485_cov_314.962396_g464_i0~~NODE_617_length_1485_cov_314.962396_g464_i0.p1  ORF type:complete len:383 (-),score=82.55 NODE_617_length_1485_cov_314.962396_g464_i0:305-1453(-)
MGDDQELVIDLSTMVQSDVEGGSRPVRQRKLGERFEESGWMSAECPWYWMDDTGEWAEYDYFVSNLLSEALTNGQASVNLRAGELLFVVDLWGMEQVETTSGISRPITQEPVPFDWGDAPIYGNRGAYGATEAEANLAIAYDPTNPQASMVDSNDIALSPDGDGLIYNGSLFPHPLPAVTDPRPDEAYRQMLEQKSPEAKEKKKGISGFISKVVHRKENANNESVIADENTRMELFKKFEGECATLFPDNFDALVVVFECWYMAGEVPVKGKLFLTEGNVLFAGGEEKPVRVVIPLAEIASIQKAVALGSAALQVFTSGRNFFQLTDFIDVLGDAMTKNRNSNVQGTVFDRVYNYLDHLWRGKVEVPLPEVQYLPLGSLFVH